MLKVKSVLMSGASGFIGHALRDSLIAEGIQVTRLVRSPQAGNILWNPRESFADISPLEGFDAVIHLSGESIAGHRWTPSQKEKILTSRTLSTKHLTEALAKLERKPKVLISASALGWYGRGWGDEMLTEDLPSGSGFLASVCREWERAAEPARSAGIRTVHPRISVVLAPEGGALKSMLLPFKWALGGRLGSGRQWMSWISLRDLVRGIEFALTEEDLEGPVNLCTPSPVQNKDFTAILAGVLGRPACLPVPEFALKLALGEMAEELLLESHRCYPERLRSKGFRFVDADLEACLRYGLTRKTNSTPLSSGSSPSGQE